MIHALIILITLAIIAWQINIFLKTRRLIGTLNETLMTDTRLFRGTFYIPRNDFYLIDVQDIMKADSPYRTCTDPKKDVAVVLIHINDSEYRPIEYEIENSINTYLLRNKGAASDFNLIKDIVERNTDAAAAEIESQTAVPLYLGLIGTVVGIIFGLLYLSVSGADATGAGLNTLLVGVAIAMAASGCGVLLTALSIWSNKQCTARVEAGKNRFYTWFQTEMLPILSQSAVSTITLLQRNLNKFNEEFVQTIDKLDKKLSSVGDIYWQQIDLLDKINKLDMMRVAAANIEVLKQLNNSTTHLQKLGTFIENSGEYVAHVKNLNEKLDAHLEREKAITDIADFYKESGAEIRMREAAMSQVATRLTEKVDATLAEMAGATQKGLNGLQQVFTRQMEQIGQITQDGENSIKGYMRRLDTVIEVVSRLEKMPEAVGALVKVSREQAQQTQKLVSVVQELQKSNAKRKGGNDGNLNGGYAPQPKKKSWLRRLFTKRKKSDRSHAQGPLPRENAARLPDAPPPIPPFKENKPRAPKKIDKL